MEQTKRKELKEEEIVSQFINTETGEIQFVLREGDSIRVDTRENKEERLSKKEIKKKKLFVKVFKDTTLDLVKENLTKNEYKILFVAMAYLDKASGILIEDGVNITKSRFMEMTEMSHNTFNSSINKLITLKIMARTKCGRNSIYLLNPFIFMNGTYINLTLYRTFKNSK